MISRARLQAAPLGALGWLHFLNDGAANYLPGILPAILIGLKLDVSLAGVVMTALIFGQALQPVTGWLADRFGGRRFIAMGLLGTTFGAALLPLLPQAWLLWPVLLIMGSCNAVFHPQAMAGARQVAGDQQGLAMSIYLVGGEIGRGIWPLLASLIVVHFGLKWIGLLAVPALLTLPVLWETLPVQPRRQQQHQPIDWRRHLVPVAVLVLFCFLRALCIFGLTTFLPIYWHQQGGSLVEGASTITVMLIVGVVGNVGGGHLADRIGRRPVLVLSSLVSCLLLVVFLLTSGEVRWLLLGLLGVALFASLPLGILIAQDMFPENRSFGSGVALGFCNGTAALALSGLGVLASVAGTVTVLWTLAGALALAILVAMVMPTGE
jgi:FSR family fosmidomycin resistance protein-like MFS transporter